MFFKSIIIIIITIAPWATINFTRFRTLASRNPQSSMEAEKGNFTRSRTLALLSLPLNTAYCRQLPLVAACCTPIATQYHPLPPATVHCRQLYTHCHSLPLIAASCCSLPPVAAHCRQFPLIAARCRSLSIRLFPLKAARQLLFWATITLSCTNRCKITTILYGP